MAMELFAAPAAAQAPSAPTPMGFGVGVLPSYQTPSLGQRLLPLGAGLLGAALGGGNSFARGFAGGLGSVEQSRRADFDTQLRRWRAEQRARQAAAQFDRQLRRDDVADQQYQQSFDYRASRDEIDDAWRRDDRTYSREQDALDRQLEERRLALQGSGVGMQRERLAMERAKYEADLAATRRGNELRLLRASQLREQYPEMDEVTAYTIAGDRDEYIKRMPAGAGGMVDYTNTELAAARSAIPLMNTGLDALGRLEAMVAETGPESFGERSVQYEALIDTQLLPALTQLVKSGTLGDSEREYFQSLVDEVKAIDWQQLTAGRAETQLAEVRRGIQARLNDANDVYNRRPPGSTNTRLRAEEKRRQEAAKAAEAELDKQASDPGTVGNLLEKYAPGAAAAPTPVAPVAPVDPRVTPRSDWTPGGVRFERRYGDNLPPSAAPNVRF